MWWNCYFYLAINYSSLPQSNWATSLQLLTYSSLVRKTPFQWLFTAFPLFGHTKTAEIPKIGNPQVDHCRGNFENIKKFNGTTEEIFKNESSHSFLYYEYHKSAGNFSSLHCVFWICLFVCLFSCHHWKMTPYKNLSGPNLPNPSGIMTTLKHLKWWCLFKPDSWILV